MRWRWEQVATWLLSKHSSNAELIGAEIGVKEGRFVYYMLNAFPNMRLYAVDPRTEQPGGAETYQDWDWQQINNEYRANIAPFPDRVIEINKMSFDAVDSIPDKSLDFVFLDAQHDYESVKRDIHDWLPKIKAGGLMSGHDYDPNPERNYGVIPAVDEAFDSVMTGANFTWAIWI